MLFQCPTVRVDGILMQCYMYSYHHEKQGWPCYSTSIAALPMPLQMASNCEGSFFIKSRERTFRATAAPRPLIQFHGHAWRIIVPHLIPTPDDRANADHECEGLPARNAAIKHRPILQCPRVVAVHDLLGFGLTGAFPLFQHFHSDTHDANSVSGFVGRTFGSLIPRILCKARFQPRNEDLREAKATRFLEGS